MAENDGGGGGQEIIIPEKFTTNPKYESAAACIADIAIKIYANNVNLRDADAPPITEMAAKSVQAANLIFAEAGAAALVG